MHPRAHAVQQQKPQQGEGCAPKLESWPGSLYLEKALVQKGRPSEAKNKINNFFFIKGLICKNELPGTDEGEEEEDTEKFQESVRLSRILSVNESAGECLRSAQTPTSSSPTFSFPNTLVRILGPF